MILLDSILCGAAVALLCGVWLLGYRSGYKQGRKDGWESGIDAVEKVRRLGELSRIADVHPISEGRGWP